MTSVVKYRVDPAAVPAATLRPALRQLRWLVLLTVLGLAITFFVLPSTRGSELILSALGAVGTAAIAVAVAFVLGLRRARRAMRSLEVILSNNALRVQSSEIAPIEVVRSDVTRIIEIPGVGLAVHTRDPSKILPIPMLLEGFASLRAQLQTWRPFEPAPARGRPSAAKAAGALALLVPWAVAGLAPNVIVAAAAALVLVVVGTIALRSTLRSTSNNAKAPAVISLVMIMMSPLARLVLYFLSRSHIAAPS